MTENPQIQSTEESQNQEEEILKGMNEYRVPATTERMFDRLPKVFIDGYSLTKISLSNDFVNCTNYISRSKVTFQGCLEYVSNELRDMRGIYYILNPPVYSFGARRKLTRDLQEMKGLIMKELQSISQYLELGSERLLISYDNYGVVIYDKYIKGRVLKFPLVGQNGHLYIVQVPKPGINLKFEKVTSIDVYNHRIEFEKEVTRFSITTFGGYAALVFNQNDIPISVKVSSPDHGEQTIMIRNHELVMFTHPKPRKVQD